MVGIFYIVFDIDPIGVITMIESGKLSEKIIALPFGDPTCNQPRTDEKHFGLLFLVIIV
jgi:inorganic pyrophosphatase